jgi:hypothetical protein
LKGPVPIAFAGSLKSADFGGVPRFSQPAGL